MSPYDVESHDLMGLGDVKFTSILNDIIQTEAGWFNVPGSQVETNLRTTVPDGRVDARIQTPINCDSRWLPPGQSAWQFKSGPFTAGKIRAEITRPSKRHPLLHDLLSQGATYVLAVGYDYNSQELDDRNAAAEQAIASLGFSCRAIMLGASQLATWASELPSIGMKWFGSIYGGLWNYGQWLSAHRPVTRVFVGDISRHDAIKDIQGVVRSRGEPRHARIEGRAGVGKTRLALEALGPPGVREMVLYARSPERVDRDFWPWVRSKPNFRGIIVLDECSRNDAEIAIEEVLMCGTRIRLVTIGTDIGTVSSDRFGSPLVHLKPLPDEGMGKLLETAFTGLKTEWVRLVVRLSGGFVKIAVRLAEKLSLERAFPSIEQVLKDRDLRLIARELIADNDKLALMRIVSLFDRVGWEGEVATECQAVAQFVGFSVSRVRQLAYELEEEGWIARRGRFLYVTPDILSLWLAWDCWNIEKMRIVNELYAHLGRAAQESMERRMLAIRDHEVVKNWLDQQLSPGGLFRTIDDLDSEAGSRLLYTLAHGSPNAGLGLLNRLLGSQGVGRLLTFARGRRNVVWTLEYLASKRETFLGSARLLLALAEAENETWSNNSTGVWCSLFLTVVASTEVAPEERYPLIEEALKDASTKKRLLAVKAVESALAFPETGSPIPEEPTGAPMTFWRPQTWEDVRVVKRKALDLLDQALANDYPEVQRAAATAALASLRGVARLGLATDIIKRVVHLMATELADKRKAREQLEDVMEYDSEYLSETDKLTITELLHQLIPQSFPDRLHRWVGKWSHLDWMRGRGTEEVGPLNEIRKLVEEVVANPELLKDELNWLMSPDAENSGYFSLSLGEHDVKRRWFKELCDGVERGGQAHILGLYLEGRRQAGDDERCEQTLDALADSTAFGHVVLEASWRGPATIVRAERLLRLVRDGKLPARDLAMLERSRWPVDLLPEQFKQVIDVLTNVSEPWPTEAAADMLLKRLESYPNEKDALKDVSWKVLENPALVESSTMGDYYWGLLSKYYVDDNPVRFVKAWLSTMVLQEGYHHEQHFAQVLKQAVNADPKGTWEVIGQILEQKGVPALQLRFHTPKDFLSWFGAETLIAWIDQEPAERATLVCSLAEPSSIPLDDITRVLLSRYGTIRGVGSALAANFVSGSWVGSAAEYYRGLLQHAQNWVSDPDPNVRAWAAELTASLQESVKREEQREAEEE